MTDRAKDIDDRWRRLTPPGDVTLAGTPAAAGSGPRSYLAVDSAGVRHLLVPTSPNASVGPRRPARGLDVQVRDLAVADAPVQSWIDLQCTDTGGHGAFTALTADVLTALAAGTDDSADTVRRALSRWRWFWTADSSRLIEGGALGLLGELWFLTRWLGPPVSAGLLQRWYGPTRTRHDFVAPAVSVEVKTTASRPPGGAVHRIASLEQLEDAETGQLYLFSLQLAHDQLATISLTGLVDELMTQIAHDPEAMDLAAERLAATGWTPEHADDHRRPYRILAEELYEVGSGFPRLTRTTFRGGLPEGVSDVSYSLALAACRRWRVDTHASDAAVTGPLTLLLPSAPSPPQ